MKQILLIPNHKRDQELKATKQVSTILKDAGCNVLFSAEYADGIHAEMILPNEKALQKADAIVTLGGDGTILHIAKDAAKNNLPVLGINLGHRGYMAALSMEELHLLPTLLMEDTHCENRMRIDVEVAREGQIVFTGNGLNDAVVTKGTTARLLPLSVHAAGNKIAGFRGDGVIVATATGSTAYSMAAGGPVLDPISDHLVITPICAHQLLAKAFVLNSAKAVSVEITDLEDKDAYLSVDGGEAFPLQKGDKVHINRAKIVTKLIGKKNNSFYEQIGEKLR